VAADVRLVVALGGNALLRRGERPDAAVQQGHVRVAAQALAPLARQHQLLLCHGNGPQVGLLALESAADASLTRAYPLDALGAQTQGLIGYWLAQELRNAGVEQPVVAVVSQTVVDAADPAFEHPSKPIGGGYSQEQAQQLAAQHGWQVGPDGPVWRRVVASPQPLRLVEQDTVRRLVDAGTVVVCGGGGGAPVTEVDGRLQGVDAVVDKDLTAAMLALVLGADRLLLLTDVPALQRDFGTPQATPVPVLTLAEIPGLRLPPGSMGPKVEACRRFTAATGLPAGIGALSDVAALLEGTAGTTVIQGTAPTPPSG